MSYTVRCWMCKELLDAMRHPELNTPKHNCCQDCWHRIQDYLTSRGFAIVAARAPEGAPAKTEQPSVKMDRDLCRLSIVSTWPTKDGFIDKEYPDRVIDRIMEIVDAYALVSRPTEEALREAVEDLCEQVETFDARKLLSNRSQRGHITIDTSKARQALAASQREGKGKWRRIDEKFDTTGEIVKRSNGEAIPEDEPLFLLRARDRLAIQTLAYYKQLSTQDGCNDYHFSHLDKDIELFCKFKDEHPERMKQPSVTRGR